jgi:hypothetical protein
VDGSWFPPLGPWGWAAAAAAAFSSGLSKAGIIGVGLVSVWLMAEAFPARESTGALLLVLIVADALAAGSYRRHADWRLIARLMPPAMLGLGAGWLLMGRIPEGPFRMFLGLMVLAMLGLQIARSRFPTAFGHVPHSAGFGWAMGFAMGFTTLVANAAGPVATLYLLARGAEKMAFVGTAAWFFLAINWMKVPLSVSLGILRPEHVAMALVLAPATLLGVIAGRKLLGRLSQRTFERITLALTLLAAIRLLAG